MPRIFIVTGEASGDVHGGRLALALQQLDPAVAVTGVGGVHMQEAGVNLLSHIRWVDGIGMLGLTQLHRGIANFLQLRQFLKRTKFDAVVFIDNPGLNLRLARSAKHFGHRVVYYIAPQVWAWGPGRLKVIARVVDRMIVILPFEEAFFRQKGVRCDFVGHPLLDSMTKIGEKQKLRAELGLSSAKTVVGLLPGSRDKEVRDLLPVMLQAMHRLRETLPDLHCVIAQASLVSTDLIAEMIRSYTGPIHVVPHKSNEVMAASDVLLVASGTATLQAAIIGTPMVIVYRVSWLTYQAAKRLVKVPFIGLVNLIAGRSVSPEIIQNDVTPERMVQEVLRIVKDRQVADEMRHSFDMVRKCLGAPGASTRAARLVLAECRA